MHLNLISRFIDLYVDLRICLLYFNKAQIEFQAYRPIIKDLSVEIFLFKSNLLKIMAYTYCIGLDVAKNTLDYAILYQTQVLHSGKIRNTPAGFNKLKASLQERHLPIETTLFCLEHTGIYSMGVLTWLGEHNYAVLLESGLAIKRSSGLQRGKNDKVDAQRIALYGYRYQDKIQLWKPERQPLQELKLLASQRRRFVDALKLIKQPLQEMKSMGQEQGYTLLQELCGPVLESLKTKIDKPKGS